MKCGFDYGIGEKYQPIWVLVLDLNKNSGFGCTLVSTAQYAIVETTLLSCPNDTIENIPFEF